jgi:hypothetical protein
LEINAGYQREHRISERNRERNNIKQETVGEKGGMISFKVFHCGKIWFWVKCCDNLVIQGMSCSSKNEE